MICAILESVSGSKGRKEGVTDSTSVGSWGGAMKRELLKLSQTYKSGRGREREEHEQTFSPEGYEGFC